MPPTPKRRPRTDRPRPISPRDNPSTTGQLINPNGSYVANPVPTTAYAGGQGGFGATLPRVQFNNFQSPFWPPAIAMPNVPKATQSSSSPGYGVNGMSGNQVVNAYRPPAGTPPVGYGPNANQQPFSPALAPNQAMQQWRAGEKAIAPEYGIMAQGGRPQTISPASLAAMGLPANAPAQQGYKLVNGQWVDPTNPAAAQQGTAGNSDFMNTNFMQKNVANDVAFTNQLRWDPGRGKFVKIGQLLQEGKLDLKGNTNYRGKKKPQGAHRRAQIAAAQQQYQQQTQAPQQNPSYSVSNDFISINTANNTLTSFHT